ncbi:MAG: chemotaxis response regulator protein-glutamate methylesterase [Clostridiaceae bacterium]|jgi:two-component system chemotaxis response regulator CheB|nr:chemotaxis response regulator protein-glutamate methylesterase [Clostridiaceae bacterium]
MNPKDKIKVLVVDDSAVFREVLSRGLSSDPNIEVVAKAIDPFDAVDKIMQYKPHVITCDIEMPKMNGIEFIRRLMPQYPLPVVVVSTISQAVFDAMNAGAVDFVTKPDMQYVGAVENFINDMIVKVKIAAMSKVALYDTDIAKGKEIKKGSRETGIEIIAIGASTGGTVALQELLKVMHPNMPGIVITQHIPPVFSRMFAERLDSSMSLSVKEAQTGDVVKKGKVLIAPGDRHMIVKKYGSCYKVECYAGDKVNGHCPSVDVLFESVAREAKNQSIGIILTGMGRDGAKGLLSMRRAGAQTIGQDQGSSVVYGMPKVAYDIGAVKYQLPLEIISSAVDAILKER